MLVLAWDQSFDKVRLLYGALDIMSDEQEIGPSVPSPRIVDPPDAANTPGQFTKSIDKGIQLLIGCADRLKPAAALLAVTKSKDALEDLVTQLREANQNLVIAAICAQEMQATAEATNQRQVEFLSMLAHELRNPLAPVALATELVGKIKDAHPQLPKLHGIISRQVSHMTRLIDDLLDASRVSSGKVRLHMRPLLLSNVIASAVETGQPYIDKRRQSLRIDMPDTPIVIDGDLTRLTQVFSNLLINAAKFSPEGETVTLAVSISGHVVSISVKDNGVGIAADFQPFIFDLFTQGPRSLDRSQGGLGIGLSLVRTIVESHGGTVSVHSDGGGRGSEFTVQMALAADIEIGPGHSLSHMVDPHRARILLVEDNLDINQILNNLLTQTGHIVTSAYDGTAALQLAKDHVYDVIVCDIGLPGMDGYALVEELQGHLFRSTPCFIAMTGYNQPESRSRAMSVGFDHYLVKPIAADALVNIIADCNLH